MIRTALTAAAAIGLAATAAPAIARDQAQVAVSYADLNLNTPEGREVLKQRLDDAARQACGVDVLVTGSRIPSRSARTCYREATANSQRAFVAILEKKGVDI